MAEEAVIEHLEHGNLQQLEIRLADTLTPQAIALRRRKLLDRVQSLQREQA